jgi:hypothetical protein
VPNAGIIASSIVVAAGVDVLLEPFNNFTFAPWTLNSTPTIVAGRNGTAAQATGTVARANYAIPTPSQSDVVTIGFAYRVASVVASGRIFELWSDTNATTHTSLATTATGSLFVTRAGTTIATSVATGLVVANTWCYIETQFKLGDAPDGYAIVRVNGTEVINSTGLDTKNAGTKTVYDAVRLVTPSGSGGGTNQWDDLYITTGAGAPFKGDITVP